MTETITSPHNPRLKLLRKLQERKHREREGLFCAEGEDLLAAAAAAGWQAETVFCVPGTRPPAGLGGELLEVEPDVLAAASALGQGSRVIGIFAECWAELPATGPCAYLHGVGDPGNMGAALRSVHALLGGAVVPGPDCADPFGPRAVRASMGSVFGVPLARGSWEDLPRPLVALVPRSGTALWDLEAEPAPSICLGGEREGLPPDLVAAADAVAHIPMRSEGAESLNVAMACAITCAVLGRHTLPATYG